MRSCLVLFLCISTTYSSNEGSCQSTFSYHQSYGYGYEMSCEKLNFETIHELSNAETHKQIQLKLSNSNLKSVTWQIWRNYKELMEIDIVNSTLENSNIFENLTNLETLKVENSIVDYSSYKGISTLLSLNKLFLINNSLSDLKIQETLNRLRIVNLNNNKLKSLEDYSPCRFPNVLHLYLQNNYLSNITNTTCLQSIEILYLDYNNIDYINLALPFLEILSVSYNKLQYFEAPKLPLLTELNLEGNKIKAIEESTFENIRNLNKLNLKNNKLTTVSSNFFVHLKLNTLNLNGNEIYTFRVDKKARVATLDLANNHLVSMDFLRNLDVTNHLDLSFNAINKIPEKIFQNFTYLSFLNLSYNNVGEEIYPETFRGLASLIELDLSNTQIHTLPSSVFAPLDRLKILNMSNNLISDFTGFDGLPNLSVLNISHNRLQSLSSVPLKNYKYLSNIDLDGNQLKHLDYIDILDQLQYLQMISIRNNSLTCEYLDEIIKYFKNNSVSYTLDTKFDYDEENVKGIYCKEHEEISFQTLKVNRSSLGIHTVILVISLSVLLILIMIVIWSIRMRYRRRCFISDEHELLDARRRRSPT